ncbi:MAG: isochorismatase family protein [candidate division WOR-3 bacterium]
MGLLDHEGTFLLVVDIQEKFRGKIYNLDEVIENTIKLVKLAEVYKMPIVVTEQYPQGLGRTIEEITKLLPQENVFYPVEKITFSCVREPKFTDILSDLRKSGYNSIIVCGIEAHICVYQTSIELLELGFNIHLASDATGSREKENHKTILRFLLQKGINVKPTETIIFEVLKAAQTPEFKTILPYLK